MKVLNLLTSGNSGGIESLCRDIGKNCRIENGFCFLFNNGTIYDQMKDLGITAYDLSNCGKKLSFEKWNALKNIAKDYDIIVVHHGDPILKLYFLLLHNTFKNKKFVTFVHSCYEEKYFFPENKAKRKIAYSIFQNGLDKSDYVVFVSNAGKISYEKVFKLDSSKCQVVYNGISPDKINDGKNIMPKNHAPYTLTYIGRLVDVKGVKFLINAFNILNSKYDIELSIIGYGPQQEKLENMVKEYNLNDKIHFLGQQSDVKPFLRETDIFVYPSVCQEVFGISIVEAMAYGCIVIANNVGGIPEIIEDKKSGFLNKETSDESLAACIEAAIYMLEKSENVQMSNCAKQTAEKFSINNNIKKLEKIYKTLGS